MPLISNSIEILKKKNPEICFGNFISGIIWKIFPSFIHSFHIDLGSI